MGQLLEANADIEPRLMGWRMDRITVSSRDHAHLKLQVLPENKTDIRQSNYCELIVIPL
jgi:hypothetical protein